MIGKLAARDSGSGRQFKPQAYQGKRGGQNRDSYDRCSYDQQGYKNRYRLDSGDRNSIGKIEVDQGMNKVIEEEMLKVMQDVIKILKDKIVQESTEIIIEMTVMAEIEIGTGLEKDHFLETSVTEEMIGNGRSTSNSRSR